MIKKVSETTPTQASVVNSTNNSTEDTYSCNYINEHECDYSTNEKKIGTWIDGKPLYRKVISFNNAVANDATYAHGISNVNYIWVAKAFFCKQQDISWQVPIDLFGGTGSTTTDRVNLYVNTSVIGFKCDTSWGTGWTKVIVLEYTKTTD